MIVFPRDEVVDPPFGAGDRTPAAPGDWLQSPSSPVWHLRRVGDTTVCGVTAAWNAPGAAPPQRCFLCPACARIAVLLGLLAAPLEIPDAVTLDDAIALAAEEQVPPARPARPWTAGRDALAWLRGRLGR